MESNAWPWTWFHPHELASPDTGESLMMPAFMDKLQLLREVSGHPIGVSSGYRTRAHNTKIGGSPQSAHVLGRAVDIIVKPERRFDLVANARGIGFTGVGIAETFIHLDDMDGTDRTRPFMWIYG